MKPGRAIYAEDLAGLMGSSVTAARRTLRYLRRKHGPTVVGETPASGGGVRLWTTFQALSTVMPSLRRDGKDVFDRVDRLEREVKLLKELAVNGVNPGAVGRRGVTPEALDR